MPRIHSSLTVNRARPLFRLLFNTRRPVREAIRSLNPCLFFLFLLLGWKVRFMTGSSSFYRNCKIAQVNKIIFFPKKSSYFLVFVKLIIPPKAATPFPSHAARMGCRLLLCPRVCPSLINPKKKKQINKHTPNPIARLFFLRL